MNRNLTVTIGQMNKAVSASLCPDPRTTHEGSGGLMMVCLAENFCVHVLMMPRWRKKRRRLHLSPPTPTTSSPAVHCDTKVISHAFSSSRCSRSWSWTPVTKCHRLKTRLSRSLLSKWMNRLRRRMSLSLPLSSFPTYFSHLLFSQNALLHRSDPVSQLEGGGSTPNLLQTKTIRNVFLLIASRSFACFIGQEEALEVSFPFQLFLICCCWSRDAANSY